MASFFAGWGLGFQIRSYKTCTMLEPPPSKKDTMYSPTPTAEPSAVGGTPKKETIQSEEIKFRLLDKRYFLIIAA